jgi:hypothetical protein
MSVTIDRSLPISRSAAAPLAPPGEDDVIELSPDDTFNIAADAPAEPFQAECGCGRSHKGPRPRWLWWTSATRTPRLAAQATPSLTPKRCSQRTASSVTWTVEKMMYDQRQKVTDKLTSDEEKQDTQEVRGGATLRSSLDKKGKIKDCHDSHLLLLPQSSIFIINSF